VSLIKKQEKSFHPGLKLNNF